MSYGLLMSGPMLHVVYGRIIPVFVKGNSYFDLAKKLTITQTIWSLTSISSFYIFVSQMEGKDLEGTYNELREKLLPTYKTNLYIWPLLQLVNFTVVPLQL